MSSLWTYPVGALLLIGGFRLLAAWIDARFCRFANVTDDEGDE